MTVILNSPKNFSINLTLLKAVWLNIERKQKEDICIDVIIDHGCECCECMCKYVKCKMEKFQSDAYHSFVEQENQGLFLQSTGILKLTNTFL